MKKVRILSLDGGGIRGIIPAYVLKYVEEKAQEMTKNQNLRIADLFDLIVGTSTGGILSCFYLTPNSSTEKNAPISKYQASEALEFYVKKGYSIFNASKRNNWLGLRSLFNANTYSPGKLERIFEEEFGNLKMHDLLKPCLVTTYNMYKQSSFFFHSEEPPEKKREFFVKDVVRSTSAAPTYFPPAIIKNIATQEQMVNIDGGVFANNPSMCAYAEARDSKFEQYEYPSAKDMLILSIGTGGQFKLPNVSKSKKWGLLNWAKSIPDIMMDGSLDTVDYQMKKIFETLEKEHQSNYKRIDVPGENRKDYSENMADASSKNIEDLQKAAQIVLNEAMKNKSNQHNINKFVELLIENSPVDLNNE
jgi:patatin-like phospholipase/acyl hydrolase